MIYSPVCTVLQIQELTAENEQIPILKDSLEEMKYLDSKVVGVAGMVVGWNVISECELSNETVDDDACVYL